jgi:phosphoribosylaminoimidazole-succinocarboxamide synthase
MNLENAALGRADNLPIRHQGDVHSGKVRAMYCLTPEDSERLNYEKDLELPVDTPLAVMVITDKISAYNVNWKGAEGLQGVPGKGASLNAISEHWFERFKEAGLGDTHIVDVPHPLVWIVQKAQPVMVEAIARQYITGSMWRDYAGNDRQRVFGGITMPDGLQKDQRLDNLLITPSTKGVLHGLPGISEGDDANITREAIEANWKSLGFQDVGHIDLYEKMLTSGFKLISDELAGHGYLFVDTKFEFGYVVGFDGESNLIYMDEVGTPDSSRIWDAKEYVAGRTVDKSKETFRTYLLEQFGKPLMTESDEQTVTKKKALAADFEVPVDVMFDTSDIYTGMAATITGRDTPDIEHARDEICDALVGYGLIK